MSKRFVIRIDRFRILVPAVIIVPAAAFGCYRVLTTQDDAFQWVLGVLTLAAVVFATIHYLWFYYLAIDDNSVTQVKYFGFVRRVIPLSHLTHVSAGVFRGWLFNSQSVRFRSSNAAIELIANVYDKRVLTEAIKELIRRGVHVDGELLKHGDGS